MLERIMNSHAHRTDLICVHVHDVGIHLDNVFEAGASCCQRGLPAKKAIAGGAFLGDIDDIADTYDISSAVEDLANQKFSVLRSLSKTLGATQTRCM